jgi:hypothetical protein
VVDWRGQLVEELLEPVEVGGVEGCRAEGAQLLRGAIEALGIAGSEDDLGAFGAGSAGGLEADAGAAADDDDGLSEQLPFALCGSDGRFSCHGSSDRWLRRVTLRFRVRDRRGAAVRR